MMTKCPATKRIMRFTVNQMDSKTLRLAEHGELLATDSNKFLAHPHFDWLHANMKGHWELVRFGRVMHYNWAYGDKSGPSPGQYGIRFEDDEDLALYKLKFA